jgi:hypothetical protein
LLIFFKSTIEMRKRPKIKGRGADLYLGGGSEKHSHLPQKKSAGAAVAEKAAPAANKFESLSGRGESLCVLGGVQRAMACYIRNSEKLANQAIELQELGAQWAKHTPLAPLFEAHASIARKIVERAAAAARNLWQIRDPL